MAEYAGDLVAVGEVLNVGTTTLGRVYVVGNAYNSTNQLVASAEVSAFGSNMAPGQKAPFYLDFAPEFSVSQDQSWVSSVTNVTVSVNSVFDTNATQYLGLATVNVNGDNINGTYTVTGTVSNTGDQSVGDVLVVGTFYNASSTVIGLSVTYLTTSLAPGASEFFSVVPTDNTARLSNDIANYSILIQSSPLTTTSVTPTPLSISTPTPTSSIASTQPTQSPAPLSSGLIYTIVIVVVVAAVVLATLIIVKKRLTNRRLELPPPPPPPPPPQP